MLELATALAIIAILSAITIFALRGLKSRSNFASATGDLVVGVRETRAESFSRGAATVFVVDTAGGRWWGLEDVGGDFDLAVFDPKNPTAAGDRLLVSGTLPAGVSFGPATGYGAALPAPFQLVPSFPGASPAPALPYCSFCLTSGAKPGFGFIRFAPGSQVAWSGGPDASGQQVTLTGTVAGTTLQPVLTIAVLARTGASATFETKQ
jgi:hypothetical protein